MLLPSSSLRRTSLACSITSLLVLPLPIFAQSGAWLGAPNASNWSTAAYWEGGIVADGADQTAAFVFDPIADADATRGGTIVLDSPRTIGNIVFEDTTGYGSSSMSIGGPATNLTFATTSGQPTVLVGQILNSQSSGKKALFAHNIVGANGLVKEGPGYLGFRIGAANTLTGDYVIAGGIVEQRATFGSVSNVFVRGGATLFLDFNGAGAGGVDRLNPSAPLILGGVGGGGVVVNNNIAATSNHSQTFNGVSVLAGASQIVMATETNQNMTYNLGSISNQAGGALNLSRSTANGTGVFTVTNANTDGIIGSWLTYNQGDWATQSGSNTAVAFTGYTPNTWGAGVNTNVLSHAALSNATTNTLRFNTGYSARLNLSGVNTIATGGIIAAQASPLIAGGTLTTANADGDLFIHANAGQIGLRVQSNIADNGATPLRLVKTLAGGLSIESNLTYSGGTIIGNGIVYLGTGPSGSAAGSLGTGDVLLSGNSTATANYSPNGTLAFNRSGIYTVTNSINSTVNGAGAVAQYAANGTLVLNKSMKIGTLLAQSGTTRLDFDAASAPASEMIDSRFTAGTVSLQTARLTMRMGTLEMQGKAALATAQNFALTDILGASKISVTPGAGGASVLGLGVLTRPNNNADFGGTLALTIAPGATVTTTSGTAITVLSDTGATFATVGGNDWAAKDAANVAIVGGSTIPGFYTPTGAGIFGGNVDFTLDDAVNGTVQTESVRFNQPVAGTLTVNAASTLRPSGILVTPAVGANTTTITGLGDLRANAGQNRDIPVIQNNPAGKLLVALPISDFDGASSTHLVKSGIGEVELNAANNYRGRTFVNEGILRVTGSGRIGNSTTRAGSILGRGGEVIVQDSASVFSGTFNSFGHRAGDSGTLTVKDNATYDVAADLNIGDVNSAGTLNISGNALLTIRSFFVGKVGYATGVVNQSGGTLTAGNTPAGDWSIGGSNPESSAAVGTYHLSGGLFNSLGQNFQVGRHGTGSVNISGTGQAQGTGFLVLGRFHGSTGTASISGDGSWNANPGGTGQNYFIVGEVGSGILNIADNGTLTAKNLSLAHNGGTGVVNQTGGTVDLQNTALVGANQAGILFGATSAPGVLTEGYGGVYNLNGGVLKTFGALENVAVTTPVSSVFNFNGGTIQPTGHNATFMQGLDAANVRVGGARFDTNGFDIAVAQALIHDPALAALDGGLTKLGDGRLELNQVNTYDGPTQVQGGTLSIVGSIAASSLTSVTTGGTLSGTGSVGALRLAGGVLAPGASPGILSAGNTEFAGGTFALEINGLSPGNLISNHDQLNVAGSVSITQPTNLSITFGNGFIPTQGDAFSLINNDSGDAIATTSLFMVGGQPIQDNIDFIVDGRAFQLDYNGGDGNDLALLAVPEPGSAALLLSGLGLMSAARRRRKQRLD